jgi:hypothetical protein
MIVYESVAKNKELKEQKRLMYFRSTPEVDAGSRIGEEFFPEKIEYSAKGYIDTVTKALELAAGVSGKKAQEIRKQEEVVRETEFSNVSIEKSTKYKDDYYVLVKVDRRAFIRETQAKFDSLDRTP